MNRAKSFKSIFSILTVLILLFFTSYYFIFNDIKKKNENISTLSQELASQADKQQYLVSTQKLITQIKDDIDRIDNSIIAKDGDVSFIENLESLAKSNGLTIAIDSLVFEDDKKLTGAGITTFKIRAKTSGSWKGMYRFLSEVESLPFKIKINQFDALASISQNLDSKGKPISSVSTWQSTIDFVVLKYK